MILTSVRDMKLFQIYHEKGMKTIILSSINHIAVDIFFYYLLFLLLTYSRYPSPMSRRDITVPAANSDSSGLLAFLNAILSAMLKVTYSVSIYINPKKGCHLKAAPSLP